MYVIALRMMSYYIQLENLDVEIDLEKNFTTEIINLFAEFYGAYKPGEMIEIQKVIKPNNVLLHI